MKSLSMKNRLIIGFTLFSMFFGAGNLIFPPLLGAEAGSSTFPAMIGMLLTAVVLPVLAVMSVAKHDGLDKLAGSIHPAFATAYAVLIHLMIGPFVAIPRTASTSFEMAVVPFLSEGIGEQSLLMIRCCYSFVFFVIATLVALKPTRLKDLLGKIMTPILLILIAVIFVGVMVKFPTVLTQADANYKGHALRQGFVTGYQTMDILAAFNFGAVIAINIEDFGIKDRKGVAKETILAGIGAGILLCIVYSATAYIGALCSNKVGHVENGTQILTYAVQVCFGIYGKVLIGIIFFIACFNVCVGLLCCCASYFHELVPKISYLKWLLVFSVFSFVVSCAGLNAILKVSLPILKVLCPVAIALTFYGLIRRKR